MEKLMGARAAECKAFNIDRLFEGYLSLLRIEAEYFSRLTDHKGELGRMNETHLVKLLRRYLPAKFGIGTGFIQCGGRKPRQSRQCDIIIYDAINNAPFYSSDAWSVFPIEMVYAVIEVKTMLDESKLQDCFEKCKDIRGLARDFDPNTNSLTDEENKSYSYVAVENHGTAESPQMVGVPSEYTSKLPPRFFIFGYGVGPGRELASLHEDFEKLSGLDEDVRARSNKCEEPHVHGICCLHDHNSYFAAHIPFPSDLKRRVRRPEMTYGFRDFLQAMPHLLDSMLPPLRAGLFFDLVNIHHYGSPALGDGSQS